MEKKQKPTLSPNAAIFAKELKSMERKVVKVCAELNKKLACHENIFLPEILNVNGVNKDEIMTLIEHLDAIGTSTYLTAVALRELHHKMK